MARASISLPVPLSPVISTRVSVPATMCAWPSFSSMMALRVISPARQSSAPSTKPEIFSAFCTCASNSCFSTGLVRNPNAPICVACTASGNRAVRGQQDHLQSRPADLQFLQQADAVELVHAQIRDHQIRTKTAGRGQRLHAIFHGLDFVVLGTQADGQQSQQTRVVVDHQNACLALDGCDSLLAYLWSALAQIGLNVGDRIQFGLGFLKLMAQLAHCRRVPPAIAGSRPSVVPDRRCA